MICKIVIDLCNPSTKVGAQSLRDKIIQTKLIIFRHKIPGILEYVKLTIDLIRSIGKTYDSLLENIFYALLSAPNARFT